jgi:hypothetical protein
MPDTKRFGSIAESVSIRSCTAAEAGSTSAFFEMKRRPVVVPVHSVEVSESARSIIEMSPPPRSPSAAAVRAEGPSRTQSPQNAAKSPVYRLQRARNSSSDMVP